MDVGEVYERHAPAIRRYVARLVGHGDVDDVCSAVWLSVVRSASAYEERGYPVSAWLYRVAQSRCVDRRRQEQCRPTAPLWEADGLSYDALPDVDMQGDARACLSAMRPDQALACWLHFGLGWALADVAAYMGRSVGAVKALCIRGKRKAQQAC